VHCVSRTFQIFRESQLLPPGLTLTRLGLNKTWDKRVDIVELVASCSDLMSLPFDESHRSTVLNLCNLSRSDPSLLLKSASFVLPEEYEKLRSMLEIVCRYAHEIFELFCSLLPLSVMKEMPFARVLANKLLGYREVQVAWLQARVKIITKKLPFESWKDKGCLLATLFFIKKVDVDACSQFLKKNMDDHDAELLVSILEVRKQLKKY